MPRVPQVSLRPEAELRGDVGESRRPGVGPAFGGLTLGSAQWPSIWGLLVHGKPQQAQGIPFRVGSVEEEIEKSTLPLIG